LRVEIVFVRDTSAAGVIVVVAVAVLLPVFGSVGLPVTLAVSLIDPEVAVTVTFTVTVAEAPFASEPIVQVIAAFLVAQLPWLGDSETSFSPLGTVSVSVIPVAEACPSSVTVSK
jgi:hypothetical protein